MSKQGLFWKSHWIFFLILGNFSAKALGTFSEISSIISTEVATSILFSISFCTHATIRLEISLVIILGIHLAFFWNLLRHFLRNMNGLCPRIFFFGNGFSIFAEIYFILIIFQGFCVLAFGKKHQLFRWNFVRQLSWELIRVNISENTHSIFFFWYYLGNCFRNLSHSFSEFLDYLF